MWKPSHILKDMKVKKMRHLPYEVSTLFYVTDDAIIGTDIYDKKGTENSVSMPSLKEIILGCSISGTKYTLLVHNHPSIGNKPTTTAPSISDVLATKMYQCLLAKHNVILLDHIIVSEDESAHFSFKEAGLL